MASLPEELTKTSVIKIDESQLRGHVDEVVRTSVEEALNSLLEAEADQLTGAKKHERSSDHIDTRAGSYTEASDEGGRGVSESPSASEASV